MGGFLRVLGRLPVNYRPIHAKLRKIEIKNFRGGRGGGNSLGGFLRVLGWSPEFFRIFLNFHIFIHVMAIIPSFLILSAQVCTCVVLSSHETPCQVMTNHVKSCHGAYPLISHIVSSGVYFVAIFPLFLIL